jgi:uncharacterized protein
LRPQRILGAALGTLFLVHAASGIPQNARIPSAPDRWVTDTAGFLSPGAVSALDSELEIFERRTGHQIIVYIGRTTGGVPLEDWSARAFAAWRIGRKGMDNGLALFIMAEDRRVRIEVGYGLEDKVPDITAGRIINDILIPAVREGDNDRGVRDSVAAVMRAISGAGGAPGESERSPQRSGKRFSAGEIVIGAIAVLFFLILLITNPSLALWLLFSILSGGRGGGGGGGSFRGGGGRSGGGGASGSW